METLFEKKKRKLVDGTVNKVKRNTGSETMAYLPEKSEQDRTLAKEELENTRAGLEFQRLQQTHMCASICTMFMENDSWHDFILFVVKGCCRTYLTLSAV